jgi:hypothetical protein
MEEPEPEDRYKVLTGVIAIAAGVGCVVYLIVLGIEGRVLSDKWIVAVLLVGLAIDFASSVRRVVRWMNRRDDQRQAKRPSDPP